MTHVPVRGLHKELIIAVGITTLISMVALYLPVFGILVGLFVPLPVLFYQSKLGRPWGVLVLISFTLIVGATMGWSSVTSTVFFFELGLVGLILSEVFGMNLSVEKTVAVTAGVVIAAGAMILALYALFSADSLWKMVSDYLNRNLELALAMYREMDVSEEKISILTESMEGILYAMLRIMPAVLIASTLFVVWGNLMLARPLLRSKQLFCPDFGNLNEWKAPEHIVWPAILSGVLLLLPHKGLKILGINGLIVVMTIYFFQGIAIVSFYFEKKEFPRVLRAILYGFIAIQQLVLLLVIAAGFFDMWIDFRRMKKGVNTEDEDHT
jgi:uncharacterized protein YybS (DUF2232 family)